MDKHTPVPKHVTFLSSAKYSTTGDTALETVEYMGRKMALIKTLEQSEEVDRLRQATYSRNELKNLRDRMLIKDNQLNQMILGRGNMDNTMDVLMKPEVQQSAIMQSVMEHINSLELNASSEMLDEYVATAEASRLVFGDNANYKFAHASMTTPLELPFPNCVFEFENKGAKALVRVKQHRIENKMYNNGKPVLLLTMFYKLGDDSGWVYHDVTLRVQHDNTGALQVMYVDPKRAIPTLAKDKQKELKGQFNKYLSAILALLHGLENKKIVIVRPSGNLHTAGEMKTENDVSVVWMSGVIKRPTEHLGGTHASPREHERAGHWRTLQNGKRIRIKALTVNKGTKGKIEKTYRINKDSFK